MKPIRGWVAHYDVHPHWTLPAFCVYKTKAELMRAHGHGPKVIRIEVREVKRKK